MIANPWLTQHRLLHNVVASDRGLLRLMLSWTPTIVVIPFPTALVPGSAGDQPMTKPLHVGNMNAISLLPAAEVRGDRAQRADPRLRNAPQQPQV